MRTWLILLSALIVSSIQAQRVVVHKVDGGYLYLFPPNVFTHNPAGVINVGDSITVMYSLKLVGTAKTRFIELDASRTKGISPGLTVVPKMSKTFGFFVRDTNQSVLEIIIDPSFMRKVETVAATQARDVIASQGNLDVTLQEKKHTITIKNVRLE